MTDSQPVKTSDELKQEANEMFKRQQFEKAIELYSAAIQLAPNSAMLYANRSFAHLKMECFGSALLDATKAIALDCSYVKAYYRRATAHMSLGKFKMALKDFESVLKAKPGSLEARTKYQECKALVRRLSFERAISGGTKPSVADTINLNGMTVEDDYIGPTLEDGRVTETFVEHLMRTYKAQGRLHKKYAYKILLDVKGAFASLPTLVDVNIGDSDKFTICGDIHGQFYDLMNIFELNGPPSPDNPYLFNGDFVDRGSFSVECIFTLLSFKLLYPNSFHMARGNHESANMNQLYGFEGEVRAKYSSEMAQLFTEVFNFLPLAHCLNGRVFVMHGGLFSAEDTTLADIRAVERNREPPEEGPMCDLLWSDPQEAPGKAPSKRGVGIQFGPDVTENFLNLNGLDYIVRSHEVKSNGYEVAHGGKCITVFSAPNYCDTMGNKGAYITLNGNDMQPSFTTFDAVPHPNVQPMAFANSIFRLI